MMLHQEQALPTQVKAVVHGNTLQGALSAGAAQRTVGDTSGAETINQLVHTLQLPRRKDWNKCGTMGKSIIV